jgi:hypothetical protein
MIALGITWFVSSAASASRESLSGFTFALISLSASSQISRYALQTRMGCLGLLAWSAHRENDLVCRARVRNMNRTLDPMRLTKLLYDRNSGNGVFLRHDLLAGP